MSSVVPRGGNRSKTQRTIELKIFGSDEAMELPVITCTRVSEIKGHLADMLMMNPNELEFYFKKGAYLARQLDVAEISSKTLVKGVRSFKPQPHVWPHPICIIGTGYHGLKTAMTYLKAKNTNIVCFDRFNRVGGYCWITGANKTSKLQTEFGSFHVWWGADFAETGLCGGYPTDKWSMWPKKVEILAHFQHAAEEYGVLPYVQFETNVSSLSIVGDMQDENRKYTLTVDSLKGDEAKMVDVSVMYNYPGSLTQNRIIEYPGEDTFEGEIRYGMNDDTPYDKLPGANIAILGNGAFAVENARTCIESGANMAYLVTRRKNLASPRAPCWFVHQGPYPTPGGFVLKMFEPMYNLVGFGDPWEFWSVHASADRKNVNIIQNSRFGIGDITFLMVAWGRLVFKQDTLKRCTRHTLHLTGGEKLLNVTVILKALGLLGDFTVDRLHKMKELVGNYCAGDWRRVLMIDATGMNAANFTTFSTGIGTYGFAAQNKFLHDFPREYHMMVQNGLLQKLPRHKAEEKLDKPAYLTDVKFAMSASIITESLCPKLGKCTESCPEYKHRMYHSAHNVDRLLTTTIGEWDAYQEQWKKDGWDHEYVPYPYTKEIINTWFEEWSAIMGLKINMYGPDDLVKK